MSQADQDRRVDYVEFSTPDVEASKHFYSYVFGWRFEDYGPNYTAFHDGRLAGGFAKAEKASVGGPLVVIYALDLEAIQDSVRKAGGAVIKETFSFPGGRRFHFADPTGNELAVWSDRKPVA